MLIFLVLRLLFWPPLFGFRLMTSSPVTYVEALFLIWSILTRSSVLLLLPGFPSFLIFPWPDFLSPYLKFSRLSSFKWRTDVANTSAPFRTEVSNLQTLGCSAWIWFSIDFSFCKNDSRTCQAFPDPIDIMPCETLDGLKHCRQSSLKSRRFASCSECYC